MTPADPLFFVNSAPFNTCRPSAVCQGQCHSSHMIWIHIVRPKQNQGLKLTVARSPLATNFAPGPLKVYIWSPTWRSNPQECHNIAALLTKLSQVLSINVWEFLYPIPWSSVFLYQFYNCYIGHLNPLVHYKHVKGGVGCLPNFMVN